MIRKAAVVGILFFSTALSLWSPEARAFPEMVRHGYVNCNACHVSTSGGGLLTAYGRELSRELLSTWGTSESESQFAYGAVQPPEWLALGGDFRAIQTFRDTPQFTEGRWIWMQQDLEAAASYGKFTLDATAGVKENNQGSPLANWEFLSRRHFLMYHATDEITFRGGKYLLPYGINIAEHTSLIKRGLGWDEGTETYNAEAAYQGESFSTFLTGVLGRPDNQTLDREKGVVVNAAWNLSSSKIGASYFHGSNNQGSRDVFGPYGIIGFTPSLFLLAEEDYTTVSPIAPVAGWVNYHRLDYEFYKGMHVFGTFEYSKPADTDIYGIGLQFFPRPHFDIQLAAQKIAFNSVANANQDLEYIMLHFYP